jgi:hypothetical protein
VGSDGIGDLLQRALHASHSIAAGQAEGRTRLGSELLDIRSGSRGRGAAGGSSLAHHEVSARWTRDFPRTVRVRAIQCPRPNDYSVTQGTGGGGCSIGSPRKNSLKQQRIAVGIGFDREGEWSGYRKVAIGCQGGGPRLGGCIGRCVEAGALVKEGESSNIERSAGIDGKNNYEIQETRLTTSANELSLPGTASRGGRNGGCGRIVAAAADG